MKLKFPIIKFQTSKFMTNRELKAAVVVLGLNPDGFFLK